jgi:hypothetical protein
MTELLSITTALQPTKKFLLDGVEQQIYTMNHLSPDDETTVIALLSRFNVLSAELEVTASVPKGKALAERIRSTRKQVIALLTDIHKETVDGLPLGAQAAVMEAVQEEINKEDEEDTAKVPED